MLRHSQPQTDKALRHPYNLRREARAAACRWIGGLCQGYKEDYFYYTEQSLAKFKYFG